LGRDESIALFVAEPFDSALNSFLFRHGFLLV
jgi:hypothetical protein